MHSKGICHFDLKPENILFASPDDNKIKVIDFGMAQVVPRLKKLKQLAGSGKVFLLRGDCLFDKTLFVLTFGICFLFFFFFCLL